MNRVFSKKDIDIIFKSIINNITNGMSLRKALKEIPLSSATFYKWMDSDEVKLKQYARATEERADAIFEEILEIADNQEKDVIITPEGNTVTNHNKIHRARLQVDARKWMLSKMMPKKYGDKSEVELSGELKTTPIKGITFNE